jgi:hypothetical protein
MYHCVFVGEVRNGDCLAEIEAVVSSQCRLGGPWISTPEGMQYHVTLATFKDFAFHLLEKPVQRFPTMRVCSEMFQSGSKARLRSAIDSVCLYKADSSSAVRRPLPSQLPLAPLHLHSSYHHQISNHRISSGPSLLPERWGSWGRS